MLIYTAFKIALFVVLLFPDNISYEITRLISYIIYLVDREHRHIAYINISRNLDRKYIKYSINKIIRGMYANFCQFPVDLELFKRRVRIYNWRRWIECEFNNFEEIIKKYRGGILCTLHLGNWEVGGGLLSILGYKLYAIAGTLNNKHLDEYLNDFRRRYGEEVVFKRGALENLLKSSNNKKFVLAMLTDQGVNRRGIRTKFLKDEAPTLKTPAVLHKRWNIPIICGTSFRVKNFKFKIKLIPLKLEGIESIEEIISKINLVFSYFIETNPAQWLWIHRRWNYQYTR